MRDILIENGKGILGIKTDRFINSFYINKPVCADWPDFQGSIGRYYLIFPHREDELKEILSLNKALEEGLGVDQFLEYDFINNLESGEYRIYESEEKDLKIVFNYVIYNSCSELIKRSNDVEFTMSPYMCNCIYPIGNLIYSTEPIEKINRSRIDYYKSKISSGKRPTILTYTHLYGFKKEDNLFYVDYTDCSRYIIDGHHKMIAYRELNISPRLLNLTRLLRNDLNNYNCETLSFIQKELYTCQWRNIIENGFRCAIDEKSNYTEIVDDYLKARDRIPITLLRSIYLRSFGYDDNIPIDENWVEKRIQILENRINTSGITISKYNHSIRWNDVLRVNSVSQLKEYFD